MKIRLTETVKKLSDKYQGILEAYGTLLSPFSVSSRDETTDGPGCLAMEVYGSCPKRHSIPDMVDYQGPQGSG